MTEQQIRNIVREEMESKLGGYVFSKNIQILDARNIQVGRGTGTKIGTETGQKLGFFNSTPIIQPEVTGTVTGFTAGAGSAVDHASTFTGNTGGSAAYTIGDLVKALKTLGLMKN